MQLTDEQRAMLLFIGSPDDGSQLHIVQDPDRVTKELMRLGLVHFTGKDSRGVEQHDLTDTGEQVYGELTGEDMT
jgi:hypothetical protein